LGPVLVKEYMKKRAALNKLPDFLPSPQKLAEGEKKVKVTILLAEESINFFKREAKKYGYPYQRMINKVIEQYTKHYSK